MVCPWHCCRYLEVSFVLDACSCSSQLRPDPGYPKNADCLSVYFNLSWCVWLGLGIIMGYDLILMWLGF